MKALLGGTGAQSLPIKAVPHLWPQANARSSQFHPVVQVSIAALLLKRDQGYPVHHHTLLVLLTTRRKNGNKILMQLSADWRENYRPVVNLDSAKADALISTNERPYTAVAWRIS